MSENRLDVGFIPVEVPGRSGTGATQTSTLLIEHLSRRHNLTVYVSSQRSGDPDTLPATDRVEYVIHDELPWLPHPIPEKQAAVAGELSSLERHDLVHSYSSAFIPTLANLATPTLVTLNSYLALCPKADFRYRGTTNCTGPGRLKCAECVPATAINRRQGVISELKAGYFSLGRFPLVWRSMQSADDITQYQALSPHLREDYVRNGFPADRIAVIPHFYDERFLVNATETQNGPNQPARLLYVGALQDIKGVDVLIRALPHLIERGIDFELEIVGSGPLEDRLKRQAVDFGVDSYIEWTGRLEYEVLPERYRAADCFVYPGLLDEPFGRVMLEAMASRTPIASSDIGSMSHIVGPTGTCFEPGDPGALASAIDGILEEYSTYTAHIDEQLARFAPDRVIDRFDRLYHRTAGSQSGDKSESAHDLDPAPGCWELRQ